MNIQRCPFCGAQPEHNGYGYYHLGTESQEISCTNAACRVQPSVRQCQNEYGEWSLEEAWNTRIVAEHGAYFHHFMRLYIECIDEPEAKEGMTRALETWYIRHMGEDVPDIAT